MLKDKSIWIFTSIIGIIFFIIFILNFEILSSKIFLPRYRGDYKSLPFYELILGFVSFFIISIGIVFINNKKYLHIWFIKGGIITLFLMVFYEAHYGLDAYWYVGNALKEEVVFPFGESGTYNIMHINHIFTYFVGKSYYSLKIVNSFIGFLGLILLYKSYEHIINNSELKINKNFIYFFFLFPSIIFWSSILGKDPLNLFFIGLFVYGFIHLIDKFKFTYLLIIIISIWFVSYIRSWWSIIMITSIFFYYIKINSTRNFFIFIFILPIFIFAGIQFLETQGISSFEQIFLKMTETSQNLAHGGSSIGGKTIAGFGDYIFLFIPNLFTTLFRPMPWDIRNAFTLIAAIENIFLFYLTYKYIFKNWRLIYANKYLKFYILLIFSWSLFYVIISPTNLGMAARFKLQVLPIMLILIGISKGLRKKRLKHENNSNNH
jgi:hypothetical protein